MENLLTALQNADRVCRNANVHHEAAARIEQEAEALQAGAKKTKIKWILIGIGIWYLMNMVGTIFIRIPYIGAVLVVLCSLAGMAGGIYIGMNGLRKARAELNAKLTKLRGSAQAERDKAQAICDAGWRELAILPEDYRYPLASTYLVRAVAAGRVTTLAEALDRFDAQLHRWKIEQANDQIVSQQQAQSKYLRSIDKTSKVNAAANVANAVFTIASKF